MRIVAYSIHLQIGSKAGRCGCLRGLMFGVIEKFLTYKCSTRLFQYDFSNIKGQSFGS